MRFGVPNKIWLFTIFWFIVSFTQASFSEIIHDEAYYWMYSQNMAWGYFDHPPMVAVFIKISSFLFSNEAGVRFISSLTNALCIPLLWNLIDSKHKSRPENINIFILIVSSMVLFTAYGFITTPDTALMFFALIFYWSYRRFVRKQNFVNSAILAISMALMMYSKYHGAFIILLVVLSNLSLFKSKFFYLSCLLGLLMFMPHLYWQYSSDFPSFKYHLFDRISGKYHSWSYVFEYLLNQLVITSPLVGGIYFYGMYKTLAQNKLERALKFVFYGFVAIFLVISITRRVEAHWTAYIIFPTIYFAYKFFENTDSKLWKVTKKLIYFTVFLISIVRIVIMFDIVPKELEFHEKNKWISQVKNLAKDKPVIFANSYQLPSKYSFYAGKKSYALNNYWYRKTQYDVWDTEKMYNNKDILFVSKNTYETVYRKGYKYFIASGVGDIWGYKFYDDFSTFKNLKIQFLDDKKNLKPDEIQKIKAIIKNPYNHKISLDNIDFTAYFHSKKPPTKPKDKPKKAKKYSLEDKLDIVKKRKVRKRTVLRYDINKKYLEPNHETEITFYVKSPSKIGEYFLKIPIIYGDIRGGFNSNILDITVVE